VRALGGSWIGLLLCVIQTSVWPCIGIRQRVLGHTPRRFLPSFDANPDEGVDFSLTHLPDPGVDIFAENARGASQYADPTRMSCWLSPCPCRQKHILLRCPPTAWP